ncbi:MAG TPA: DPP IV N-terminal domain-containing protein, partial [Bryobacteraceae bacterium]|nr:DPP IV N-terminal domain-containing protein [Bryobacteraceae bacterium]
MKIKATLALPAALALLQAQPAGRFALTVENIMRGPNLVGYEPAQVRWSGDSQRIYFSWKQYAQKPGEPRDTYVVNRDGSGLRKLSGEEAKSAPPVGGDSTRDHRLTVYARGGDIFLYNAVSGATRQITKTADAESNPRFLRDGKRISFTRGNNLYMLSLESGELIQMTDIVAAGAAGASAASGGRGGRGETAPAATGEPPKATDGQEYLKNEQKELLETVRERAAERQAEEDKRKKENPRKPFALQARQSVASLELTPDGKFVTAMIAEDGETRNTVVPNYVTESAYAEEIRGRANVGDTPGALRLAVIAVDTGEVKWAEPGIQAADGKPRRMDLNQPVWSDDGSKAFVFGDAADNKDRWFFALDAAAAKLRVLADIHDDAWVTDVPENLPSLNTPDDVRSAAPPSYGWMKNGREIYFDSESSGYSQLYAVFFDGGEPRPLTPAGKWEVLGVNQSA